MGKKSKHRVRHIPPGPCGVWFQATQAKKKQRRNGSNDGRRQSVESVEETPHGSVHQQLANYYTQNHGDDGYPEKDKEDTSDTPSAWQDMQDETGVTTPYNPTPWATTIVDPESRYDVVRSNLPDDYVTLWEILRGDHDMKLSPHQRLRVLVHSVEMSNHHNIWTVDLRDDTGASIKAWMEPGFIQEQLQDSNALDDEMSMVRPGMVWMLKDCSMIIMPSSSTAFVTGDSRSNNNNNNNFSEERLERMLLIARKHIENYWHPVDKKKDKQNVRTLEQTQNSQSSGNDDDPVIDLDAESAYKTPPGAKHFENGKQFASRTPFNNRNNSLLNGISSPPVDEESVSGLFSQMRQQNHDRSEPESRLTYDDDEDRPHTQELSQCAAPGTRVERPVKTPPRNSSQNPSHSSQRHEQQQKSQSSDSQKKQASSLTPLDLSLGAAADLGTQKAPNLSQFRAPRTNPGNPNEPTGANMYTQDSMMRDNSSQQQKPDSEQPSQPVPAPRTPKRKRDKQTSQRHSQSSKKRQKSAKSPARTPTRTTLSPMTQESTLLTPSRTPNRRRKALTPKAVVMNRNLWTMNDPILLEMIEKDEANELKKEMNETESISNATQQQQHDDSDSESSPIIPRTAVDIGKLFDPATWVGVDMAIFDGEDDFD